MFDCDHFKQVNDRFGHEVGDQVLIQLVRLCQQQLRREDALIRWGGEEFLLLAAKGANHSTSWPSSCVCASPAIPGRSWRRPWR